MRDILLPDGALNRPALAAKAFVDDEQRAKLNGIVHPLVGRRREEIIAAVSEDAVVVEDIPLLVETGMAPMFPLVVVVHADVETRVERLIKRGMAEADARARIAAQATEEQRRAVADVLLDNSGSQGELVERARDLWYQRVLPLAHNIRTRQTRRDAARSWCPTTRPGPTRPGASSPASKPPAVQRHCGSTTSVRPRSRAWTPRTSSTSRSRSRRWTSADELAGALAEVGYPRMEHITADVAKPDARSTVADFDHTGDAALWQQAVSRVRRSRPTGQRPHPGRRLARSAVRAAVHATGWRPTPACARTTWPPSAAASAAT